MRMPSFAVWLLLCMAACAPAASAPAAVAAPGASSSSPFAITDFGMHALGAGEAPDTQAAGHPYSLTSNFDFTVVEGSGGAGGLQPTEDVKDVVLELPEGLAIDPQVAPMCRLDQLNLGGAQTACPAASRIGTLGLRLAGEAPGQLEAVQVALYNMVPEPGYPLEFGANYLGLTILMYGSVVRTASGYGLRLAMPGVSQLAGLIGASLTLFGDPAVSDGTQNAQVGFLTNPADCATGAPAARLEVDTWQHPGQYHAAEATVYQALHECNLLRFEPTLEVVPQTTQADTPSGYELEIKAPQVQSMGLPGTPELKDATVTLPAGVSVSPPAADGLAGCAATGAAGINIGSGEVTPQGQDLGNPEASELGAEGLYRSARGSCPAASTVGTVEIETPLSPEPLAGHVYLAQPECGGAGQPSCTEADASNGRIFSLYLEAEGSGVLIKLVARVQANPTTGQLTLSFSDLPQLPISSLRLHLWGGPRALLANPQACGVAGTSGDLSPWSAPATPDATAASGFVVDWNGAGGVCPPEAPFLPSLGAYEASPTAATFSSLALSVSREDREQDLARVGVQLPPGLTWMFASVPLCGEPQASEGTCSAASEIGTTQVLLGPGARPLALGGRMYLSGPYRGAAYGLSIVVPMSAGPFNLGTVIVRAAVAVDPSSGALSISSDPLPLVLDGVPLRIRTIEMLIDRPEFILNPTYCAPRQITASSESLQGTSAQGSVPFLTPGCQSPPPSPPVQVTPTPGQGGVSAGTPSKAPKKKAKPKHKRRRKKKQKRKQKRKTPHHRQRKK